MISATLPESFKEKQCNDLLRIGSKNDGGYVISRSSILNTEILVSLGIDNNWSFEKHFLKINSVPCYAFDHSIGAIIFFKNFIKNLVRIDKPKLIFRNLKIYFSYLSFFRSKNIHVKKFVGDVLSKNYISLSEILSNFKTQKIFLKVDIEGDEYRLLDDILKNNNNFSGLIIEFHNCDLNIKKIENFLKSFNLDIINLHANNYTSINKKTRIPLSIEISFGKTKENKEKLNLASLDLNFPNNPSDEDIEINFINEDSI